MKKTTAQALQALLDELRKTDEADQLADIIVDVCEGATLLDPLMVRLMRELFESMPMSDSLNMAMIACNIEAVGTDTAREIAERVIDLSDADTILHTKQKPKVLCTRCGNNEVPAPKSIEVDPLCDTCLDQLGCPGWNDSCGNLRREGEDLCPDCTMGRLDAQSPRIQR